MTQSHKEYRSTVRAELVEAPSFLLAAENKTGPSTSSGRKLFIFVALCLRANQITGRDRKKQRCSDGRPTPRTACLLLTLVPAGRRTAPSGHGGSTGSPRQEVRRVGNKRYVS